MNNKQIKKEEAKCEHDWKIISYWGVQTHFARRQCKLCKVAQDKEITEDGWVDSPQYELSASDVLRSDQQPLKDEWEINWKVIIANKLLDANVSPKATAQLLDGFENIVNHLSSVQQKDFDARVEGFIKKFIESNFGICSAHHTYDANCERCDVCMQKVSWVVALAKQILTSDK